jgi:hypothetical protein
MKSREGGGMGVERGRRVEKVNYERGIREVRGVEGGEKRKRGWRVERGEKRERGRRYERESYIFIHEGRHFY